MQNSLYTLYYGGVFKGRWVFKGNLASTSISSLLLIILCLAVTLLTSTKVQLGSKELSFLTKENNTEVDYHIWIYILYESVDTHYCSREDLLVSRFMWSNSTPIFPSTSPRLSCQSLVKNFMIRNDQIVKSIHFEEVCTAGEGNLDCSKVVVSLPVFYKYFLVLFLRIFSKEIRAC